MEAKKIFDETLKQDGYVSQESVMPQYNSCLKAVQKALTISLTDTEEKMYSREEVEKLCRAAFKKGISFLGPEYYSSNTVMGEKEDEWIKENL